MFKKWRLLNFINGRIKYILVHIKQCEKIKNVHCNRLAFVLLEYLNEFPRKYRIPNISRRGIVPALIVILIDGFA